MTLFLTKYYLGNKIKTNEMGGACGTHGGQYTRIQSLVGKPEGKRALGKHKRRWET
jgi:hypothetical protein